MATVTIHYEGWLALPEELRERLGVRTGARVEAVAVEDGVLLRAEGARRPRGRPRKARAAAARPSDIVAV